MIAHVKAIPGTSTKVPTWILGSSLYGAQLAAQICLCLSFCSCDAGRNIDKPSARRSGLMRLM